MNSTTEYPALFWVMSPDNLYIYKNSLKRPGLHVSSLKGQLSQSVSSKNP